MTVKSSLSLVLVLDFDGTVTEKDIGDEICARFADERWRQIDEAWIRNEVTLPEAQRQIWALARATRDEAIAYAHAVGHPRPGLAGLLAEVSRLGGQTWLASGGFDFYVEALLGAQLGALSRRYYNTTRFIEGRIEVAFPHAELACTRCAVCKGRVCDLASEVAERVIFVGDGASDRCAVGRADRLFAVEGGILDRHCASLAAAATRFSRFDEITETLAKVCDERSDRGSI